MEAQAHEDPGFKGLTGTSGCLDALLRPKWVFLRAIVGCDLLIRAGSSRPVVWFVAVLRIWLVQHCSDLRTHYCEVCVRAKKVSVTCLFVHLRSCEWESCTCTSMTLLCAVARTETHSFWHTCKPITLPDWCDRPRLRCACQSVTYGRPRWFKEQLPSAPRGLMQNKPCHFSCVSPASIQRK